MNSAWDLTGTPTKNAQIMKQKNATELYSKKAKPTRDSPESANKWILRLYFATLYNGENKNEQ